MGSIPGQGTKIPHIVWLGEKSKKKKLKEEEKEGEVQERPPGEATLS